MWRQGQPLNRPAFKMVPAEEGSGGDKGRRGGKGRGGKAAAAGPTVELLPDLPAVVKSRKQATPAGAEDKGRRAAMRARARLSSLAFAWHRPLRRSASVP